MGQSQAATNPPAPSRYWKARKKLLSSDLMERQLSFLEVMRIGKSLHNRWNALMLYGMKPIEWYFSGIRILGRTSIEAHPDRSANRIGERTAQVFGQHGHSVVDLIDPFLGSGNLTYHINRHHNPQRIVACEINRAISSLTTKSLQMLKKRGKLGDVEIVVINDDWTKALGYVRDVPTLVILAPPWGAAYEDAGLDLRKTAPPIPELIDCFFDSVATDLFFLVPIAGGNTLIEPVTSDTRLILMTHYPKPASGFLLFKAFK